MRLGFLILVACAASACAGRDRNPTGMLTDWDGGTLPPDVDGATPSDTDGGTVTPPTTEWVSPTCIDGMYAETLPNPNADLSELIAGYNPADYTTFELEALSRRYASDGKGDHKTEGKSSTPASTAPTSSAAPSGSGTT